MRYAGLDDIVRRVPVSVVWEITLACDLACQHCGSRAGRRRRDELTTAEAIDLVGQIAELGTRDVGLIGGEAYLRKDWLAIVAAIKAAGMRCDLQTGAAISARRGSPPPPRRAERGRHFARRDRRHP